MPMPGRFDDPTQLQKGRRLAALVHAFLGKVAGGDIQERYRDALNRDPIPMTVVQNRSSRCRPFASGTTS